MKLKDLSLLVTICLFMIINSLGFMVYTSRAQSTEIYLYPGEISGKPRGATFTVNVNIRNVTNLYSWEVILSWDKEILEAKTATEGPFLSQGGQYQTYFVKKIYNDKGYLRLDCTILGGDPTTHADGDGTLATITFLVKTPGTTVLHFNGTLLLTYEFKEIPHSSVDGLFHTNYPAAQFVYSPTSPQVNESVTFNASDSKPNEGYITTYIWDFGDGNVTTVSSPIINHTYTSEGDYNVTLTVVDSEGLSDSITKSLKVSGAANHDIAITNVLVDKYVVYLGCPVSINVTVENRGLFAETFNVTLLANETIIVAQQVSLNSGETIVLSFLWETESFEQNRNYTITAMADVLEGEANTDDNVFVNGVVWIKMPGDVDGTGKVDYKDLFTLAASYGTKLGDENFNPSCDFNADGKVDYKDLFMLAAKYGSKA